VAGFFLGFARRGWAIAFAIPLAVMLAGGVLMLWTVYSKSRLPSFTNLGVMLFVLGFTAAAVFFGVWVASGGQRGQKDGA